MNDLRKFRANYRLTQKELGDIIGVSAQSIGKAESGQIKIPHTWIEKLKQLYEDIPANFFEKTNVSYGENSSNHQTFNEPQTIIQTSIDILKAELDFKNRQIEASTKQIDTLLSILSSKLLPA